MSGNRLQESEIGRQVDETKLLSILPRPSAALLLYLVSLLLVSPIFFLNLGEINPWDEASYIDGGRRLVAGRIPGFAGNPLVHALYALTYLLFRTSPFWMLHSLTVARFVLFSLLWLSTYLVARRLTRFARPLIPLGILLVTPLSIEMLRFPSDPLFASMAGLSLWQLLAYHQTRDPRSLWGASSFMGLAALSRNDGLVLFLVLVFLALLLSLKRAPILRSLVAVSVPFIGIVGGYVLLHGALTGDFQLGTAKRTYDNFEAGHQAIFAGTGARNPVIEAKIEARRVFGTGEENDFNVFRAILRNPGVYSQRLRVTALSLPRRILHAYGIRFAAVVFLLALRGVIELAVKRRFRLLVVLLLWPAHLVTGFVITIFRQGHLQFPYYVVFTLAAIGLAATLNGFGNRRERTGSFLVLALLALYGYLSNLLAVYYGAIVFLAGLAAAFLAWRKYGRERHSYAVMLLILLGAGVVIRGSFPSPKVRVLGVEAKEQAALVLMDRLSPGRPLPPALQAW